MLHALKIIVGLSLTIQIHSQSFVYSKNYFRWPVSIKPAIVANFGELRSDHWHMGLDIRTAQKENLPVYAAADGYIARVSVKPFGYGKAIYINHPNGLTTVYGHLNKFFPKLDSLVRAQQYKQQSWDIELAFTKDKFPVHKGQFIAHSGSTGASQGPHVHFEIRNTRTERCINPLFFNLPVADGTPPVFTRLALYDRNKSIYDQGPTVIRIKKIMGVYHLSQGPVIKTGISKLSFAIGAYDCVSGSTNQNGIYSSKIFFDGQPLIGFALDSMDYEETDYVNAHIDYQYRYNGGSYLQNLFRLPGDKGRVYKLQSNDGTIRLIDTNVHSVKIEIADIQKNTSVLNFKIQFDPVLSSPMSYAPNKTLAPNNVNLFEQPDFELYLPENCLYDSVQPVFDKLTQEGNAVSSRFQFSTAAIPVHGSMRVRLKPRISIPAELKNKIVIERSDGKGRNFRKAEWQQDWLAASFNDFGSYQSFVDDSPPTINDPGIGDTVNPSTSKRIVFYPRDNTAIKSFRAELDDKWLMFTNDKGAAWIYTFDERCPYGVHQLTVRIEDIAGNVTERKWWFKRYPLKTQAVHKKKVNTKKRESTRKSKSSVKRK